MWTSFDFFITGTKKIKWISSTTKLLQNETGTPILMTGISADITQRKESETALKNNILKTERILNSLNESNIYLRCK